MTTMIDDDGIRVNKPGADCWPMPDTLLQPALRHGQAPECSHTVDVDTELAIADSFAYSPVPGNFVRVLVVTDQPHRRKMGPRYDRDGDTYTCARGSVTFVSAEGVRGQSADVVIALRAEIAVSPDEARAVLAKSPLGVFVGRM